MVDNQEGRFCYLNDVGWRGLKFVKVIGCYEFGNCKDNKDKDFISKMWIMGGLFWDRKGW
jgi:hypothetical protein